MFQRDYSSSQISYKHDSSSDNGDSDTNTPDPGRAVIEKNVRNRLQRIANQTREELDKVLKRVDTTLSNYEYSVQSSLIQHGMARDDVSNVEHVSDIKELETLLNDNLAKQKYKQRLMIFIVGQTEQANEKVQLLQQIGQFFIEQKQSFSAREFNNYDDITETQNEFDQIIKSFDAKDCYVHVKQLGTRLTELNEQIMDYLIQNAAAKQTKGKKKTIQIPKDVKEQLSSLQSKLETANKDITNRDETIQSLENEVEEVHKELNIYQNNQKSLNDQINKHKNDIKSYKNQIYELEKTIEDYKNEIDSLKTVQSTSISNDTQDITDAKTADRTIEDNELAQINVSIKTDNDEIQSKTFCDKEMQTEDFTQEILPNQTEDLPDLNVLLKTTDEVDLNRITNENLPTAFNNLRNFAINRVEELLKELETKQTLHDEYKLTCEKEKKILIEKAENSNQLQIKTQKELEVALKQLRQVAGEPANQEQQETVERSTSLSESDNCLEESLNEHFSSPAQDNNEETESIIKCPPTPIVDDEKHEVTHFIQQANMVVSPLQTIEEILSSRSSGNINEKGLLEKPSPVPKQDQEQQTSRNSSRRTSASSEQIFTQLNPTDPCTHAFFYLYEIIYKFRDVIARLLEQNKFTSLATRLQIIQQLSIDDNAANKLIKSSETVLKDTVKILKICLTTLQSKINEYESKEKEVQPEPIKETPKENNEQASLLQEQEFKIVDLTNKYEHTAKLLNDTNKKHQETLSQNDGLIFEQQKVIRGLRQEMMCLQKHVTKVEAEGILEPSIMFTRMDFERNDQTLQNAVTRGKVSEITYNEINTTMADYIRLPSKQFINLVKRYVQFRKATEIETRVQSHASERGTTRGTLERLESFYERRSHQLSELISNLRQHRAILARTLTEKFDNLENESSIFLIRPMYSFQGRAATQSYMQFEKRRREALLSENVTKKKHNPSRQSTQTHSISNRTGSAQQTPKELSSMSALDDDEQYFHIEKSFVIPPSTATSQQNDATNNNNIDNEKKTVQLSELTRLEELDLQRSLMPMSQASTHLLSAFTNSGIDPCVPSLNLRSYVALTRPGISNDRPRKPTEAINRVSRESVSTFSVKSRDRNPRTPFNSTAGDSKRTSPPLPPIKRPLASNISSVILERSHSGFVPSLNTNEVSTTN